MSAKVIFFSKIFLLALILPCITAASYTKDCEPSDVSIANSAQRATLETRYLVGTRPVTWVQALVLCQQSGMELVSISSKYEEDVIESILDQYPTTAGVLKGYWTAATRHGSCYNDFVWFTNGKSVIYRKFAPGQPDNAAAKELCVELFLQSKGQYAWNDLPCEHTLGYVCQTRSDCHCKIYTE